MSTLELLLAAGGTGLVGDASFARLDFDTLPSGTGLAAPVAAGGVVDPGAVRPPGLPLVGDLILGVDALLARGSPDSVRGLTF